MQPNFDRRRSIWLVVFSSLGILGLLLRAGYLVVLGVRSSTSGMASSMLEAVAMLFCSALLVPMLVLNIRRWKGRELKLAFIRPVRFWQIAVLIVVWVILVVFGSEVNNLFVWGWIVAIPFFLLGILLPLVGLFWIAAGGLPAGSYRRLWSAFGIALVGSTLAAVLLEYLVVGLALVGVAVASIFDPALLTTITHIVDLVMQSNPGDVQSLLALLSPYLTNPLVILALLAFVSLLTPLIEEALKPVAVWLIGKRLRSPAEGFLLGALCGAGFAAMEGFGYASGAAQMLGTGLIARAPASLMHVTASGILGWGIASAVLHKRYGRLALAYLGSVSIHGLWNGSAVLAVYGSLRSLGKASQIDFLGALLVLAGLGLLFLLLVTMLVILPLINHALRPSAAAPVPPGPGASDPFPPQPPVEIPGDKI
jgi:RsiW-degrading membrane proteinase PrsW (M82 family)